jgi:outer membrane protein
MKNQTALSRLIAAALAVAALAPVAAQAAEGPFQVRVRAVNLEPANKDDVSITDVTLNSKIIPEVDFTYFVTPNIAAELVLTVPQKHDVSSSAHSGKIGTLRHLPPTLTAQYHFLPTGQIRPYVGAGINYTNITEVRLPLGLNVDRGSFGLAFQAGVDIQVAPKVFVNIDVKKVNIRTNLRAADGSDLGQIKVDPTLVGVGVGYRF